MIEFGGADGFPLIVPLEGKTFGAFRIELSTSDARLQFSEFQVWAPESNGGLINVARGRSASQSSTARKGYGAKKGINGQVPPEPAVSTKKQDSPWWKVELAKRRPISHIALYNQVRRPSSAMESLRILGRSGGKWHVVFDQANADDNKTVLLSSLDAVASRLGSVLDQGLLPKIVVDEQTGTPLHTPEVIGPAWLQRRRFEQLLEVVNELRTLIRATETVPKSTLQALRMAADALVPTTRPDQSSFSWFADLEAFDRLLPRSDDGGFLDFMVTPVEPTGFMVDATREMVSREPDDPSRLGQSSSLRRGEPVVAPGAFCQIALHNVDPTTRWELWGLSPDGTARLVYDNELVNTTLVVVYQVLRNLGLDTWDTLHGMLRTLELAGRYQVARGTARVFDVEDPGQAVFENAINEIEVRSFIDPAREPVSRSKHGYRVPFRLRDHVKYASGTHFLLDLVRRDRRFAQTFPAYGTLLGFVREGTFIAHDDDADLIVVTDAEGRTGMIETYQALRKYLDGRGMTLFRGGRNLPGYNLPVAFNVDGESVHIDIFFSYLEDGERVLFDVKTNTFEPVDSDLVKLGRFVEVQGQTFEIPERSEELLEFWYGPSWRTPYNPPIVGYSWHHNRAK